MPGLPPRAPPPCRTHTCGTTGIFFLIFIYLFLGVLGLQCFARASLVLASQATLHFSAQASHCGGFSRCGAQALEQGLSSCGTRV